MYIKVVRYIGLIVGYIGSNIGLIVDYIGPSLALSIRVEVFKGIGGVEISLYYT